MIFTHTTPESKQKWSDDDLMNAVSAKRSKNLSYRKAASKTEVPKRKLCVHGSGKLDVDGKQGPPTGTIIVLTAAEEETWSSMLCT